MHKILMDTDSSNICQMVTGFPYAPVAFKIFDGLNFDRITRDHQNFALYINVINTTTITVN